ncbi:hypothetical protein CDAR_270671 [Caerostris darwini]|uniref:Uncharacterized protein n=1 Tax=Caerostris darwini TaxID=1538125 RepID=A0AAV4TEC3_9ARAC|nr:hypothetical protein CDAR_270671 [Caerostris darwini]
MTPLRKKTFVMRTKQHHQSCQRKDKWMSSCSSSLPRASSSTQSSPEASSLDRDKMLTDLRRFVSKKLFRIHEKKVEEIDLYSPLSEAAGSSESSPEMLRGAIEYEIQPVRNDAQRVPKRTRKLFSIGSSDEESILSEPSPVMSCTSIDEENSDVEEFEGWVRLEATRRGYDMFFWKRPSVTLSDQKLFSIGNSGDNFISSDPSITFRFHHLIVDDEDGERDVEMPTLPFMSRSSFLEEKPEVECFDDSEELLGDIRSDSQEFHCVRRSRTDKWINSFSSSLPTASSFMQSSPEASYLDKDKLKSDILELKKWEPVIITETERWTSSSSSSLASSNQSCNESIESDMEGLDKLESGDKHEKSKKDFAEGSDFDNIFRSIWR